jgi:hypothetical protein
MPFGIDSIEGFGVLIGIIFALSAILLDRENHPLCSS